MAEIVEPDNLYNDGEPILPPQPPLSPNLSSWIGEIEEMLLNSNDDYLAEEEAPPSNANPQQQQSFYDEFFADLNLPSNEKSASSNAADEDEPDEDEDEDDFSKIFLDFEVGPEFDEIMGFNVEDLIAQSQIGGLNYESSTPESEFKAFDENSGTESQIRVLDSPVSTPESQVKEFFVDENSGSETQVRVLDSTQSQVRDRDSTPESQVRVVNDGLSTSDSKRDTKRSDVDHDVDDDPITKKQKRQMRNRDAAVKSRERKKIYVKDLEVKSRYLEGECIRLQRLLQWVAAENQALHLQLHNNMAISASRTKQESAVLLLETLLLVSLLWFLGTMGMFPHLEMRPQLKRNKLENVDSNNQKVVDLGRAKSKRIGLGTLRLFFKSKRCKASRSKMKVGTFFGAVVA